MKYHLFVSELFENHCSLFQHGDETGLFPTRNRSGKPVANSGMLEKNHKAEVDKIDKSVVTRAGRIETLSTIHPAQPKLQRSKQQTGSSAPQSKNAVSAF